MFLAYGKPTDTTAWDTTENSWEACLSLCYYDDRCQLVYRNETTCSFFEYGNITIKKMNTSLENLVAFKLNYTSDECPASIDDLFSGNLTEWVSDSRIYRNQMTADSTEWNFIYTVSKCPDNTTLYTRTFSGQTFHVCVGVRIFPNGGSGNYTDAQQLCREDNGYGMSGPLDANEFNTLKEQAQSALNAIGHSNDWIWLDGIDTTSGKRVYSFDDPSHNGKNGYPFCSGEPNESSIGAFFMIFNGYIGDFVALTISMIKTIPDFSIMINFF